MCNNVYILFICQSQIWLSWSNTDNIWNLSTPGTGEISPVPPAYFLTFLPSQICVFESIFPLTSLMYKSVPLEIATQCFFSPQINESPWKG